jgi:hypothetical protein
MTLLLVLTLSLYVLVFFFFFFFIYFLDFWVLFFFNNFIALSLCLFYIKFKKLAVFLADEETTETQQSYEERRHEFPGMVNLVALDYHSTVHLDGFAKLGLVCLCKFYQ